MRLLDGLFGKITTIDCPVNLPPKTFTVKDIRGVDGEKYPYAKPVERGCKECVNIAKCQKDAVTQILNG